MKAVLRYARIAPKKASLIAALIRRQSVDAALDMLSHFPKKGARLLRDLITSAAANAAHNAKQSRHSLFVKSLTVTKGSTFRRYIPMARGRARPIDKITSHLAVELGVLVPEASSFAKVTEDRKKAEKDKKEDVQHVDSLPAADPTAQRVEKKPAGEDPHAKGFAPKAGPKGPIFIPHQRGARGT